MKKRKKKRRLKLKNLVVIILILFIIVAGALTVKDKLFGKKAVKEVKVVDKLEKYGYSMNENATKYYQKLFKELKEELNKKEIDEEKYAKLVSQLFLADYFNLNNKLSKNDVGGVQFVYKDYQSTFVKLSTQQVYKYVESNIYGNRHQQLPVVKKVTVDNITQEPFEYNDKTDDNAYVVDLSISYNRDMGYQEKATLTLIHSGKKLEIAKMS